MTKSECFHGFFIRVKRGLFLVGILFLLFGCIDQNQATLKEVKWMVPTTVIGWCSPAINTDGTVCIEDNEGYLYAILDEGENWTHKWGPIRLAEDIGESSPTLSRDGKKLYIGSNTRPAKMFCIDTENGLINWTYTLPKNKTLYSGGLISSPALSHLSTT